MPTPSLNRQERPPRIFVGLAEVSGYGRNLKAGFEAHGVHCTFVDLNQPTYAYGLDVPKDLLLRLYQHVGRRRAGHPRSEFLQKSLWKALELALGAIALLRTAATHDAFVFLYDTKFCSYRELFLLRILRRKIVYVFCGSDVRPSYIDGTDTADPKLRTPERMKRLTERKRSNVRAIERYADAIVSHPPFAHLQRRPFVPFLSVGIPRFVDVLDVHAVPRDHDRIRVVHAPSHPVAKGTDVIRLAIDEVRRAGVDIDFVEIHGVSNATLLAHLKSCDFVVDQLYSDTPMAGLASDAALFGKPSIVGGYAWEELRRLTSPELLPPAHMCRPDEIVDAILLLANDVAYRQDLGSRANEFICANWAADVVAARFLRLIAGEHVPALLVEPSDLRYVLGWGQPEDRSRLIIGELVMKYGVSALQLHDKPELEQLAAALGIGS